MSEHATMKEKAEKRITEGTAEIINAAFKAVEDLAANEPARDLNTSTLRRVLESIFTKYGNIRANEQNIDDLRMLCKVYEALNTK